MRLLSRTILLAAGAAAALAATVSAAMLVQDDEVRPDRSETVAGWRIDDIPQPTEDDPVARLIRITREGENREISYEIRLSGYGGTGWTSTMYSAEMGWENSGCNRSGPAAVETGAPAQRPARVRGVLVRELGRLESACHAPAGTTAPLLDGFEAAFARLSEWHGERLAEIEAWAAAGNMAGYSGDNDMSMYMDTNMDTDMETGSDMGAMADMNATYADDMSMDANAMDMEYGTDMNWSASEAAEEAARAAEAAVEDGPKER